MDPSRYLRALESFVETHYGATLYDWEHFNPGYFRSAMLSTRGYLRGVNDESSLSSKDDSNVFFDALSFASKGFSEPKFFCSLSTRKKLPLIASSVIGKLRIGENPLPECVYFLRHAFLSYLKNTRKSKLVTSYLQSNHYFVDGPIFLYSSSEIDNALTHDQLSEKAYLFHRDIDSVMSIKAFIRLHELSSDGGAHVFVAGSHRFNNKLHSLNTELTARGAFSEAFDASSIVDTYQDGRFSSDSIARLYGHQSIKVFYPEFGQCWFEDTFGLHKGSPLFSGERLYCSFIISKAKLK